MKINEIKNIFLIRKFKKKDKWTEILCSCCDPVIFMIVLFICHERCYCVNLINAWCVVVEVIIFSSVRFLSKKSNQNWFFFLKKTETGSNKPVLVWFGYFGEKTSSNRFDSVFSGLAWFFSGLVWFGLVFSVSGL